MIDRAVDLFSGSAAILQRRTAMKHVSQFSKGLLAWAPWLLLPLMPACAAVLAVLGIG
jgi:hypothetical protein